MKRFSKEDIERLKEAEPYFTTCVRGGYKRATPYKLDTMVADIWDSVADSPTPRNFACGVCSYKLYLKVGEKYFQEKETVCEEPEPSSATTSISTTSKTTKNKKSQIKK